MKHAVILAHPRPTSFIGTLAKGYAAAAESLGQRVALRDLYAMEFDPRLRAGEIPDVKGFAPGADVAAERELLADVDVFALFYPFWFNTPPAMMKGYLERVFGMGFSFTHTSGGTRPLFLGRKLFSVSSSGAPQDWVKQTGALDAERSLFDAHFAAVCGLTVVDHLHFGGIVPGIRADYVEGCVEKVRSAVLGHFKDSKESQS
jgi:NAD(P)H dehydrogenase (quinone)